MTDAFFGGPFRRFFLNPPILNEWSGSPTGAMDWLETPSSHIYKINAPGFGKEDIKVQLDEGNVLHIRAEAPKEEEDPPKDAVWHLAERAKEGFSRQVVLPDNVKAGQIKAHVENGVITVVVPKEPNPAKPKFRNIHVSSKL